MNTIYKLETLFVEQQYQFLPISPPSEEVYTHSCKTVIPVDWKRFPKEFSKQMYAEMDDNGYPIYRVSVYEDPATRETVFLNSYGTEVYRLAAEKGYDPYVWQTINFQLESGQVLDDWSRWLYDPAHIAASFVLIPEVFYADFLATQAEEAAMEASMAPMMMAMSFPETVTDLMMGISVVSSNVVELELRWPDGFAHDVEIYSATSLISNDWKIVSDKLPSVGTALTWQDSVVGNSRFYDFGSLADSDLDGLSDGRERRLLGTSAFLTDSDNDGLLDNEEARMQTYVAEQTAYEWVDIEASTNLIAVWDHTSWRGYRDVSLGFDFSFYGESHTDVSVSKLGYLKFGAPTLYFANTPLPDNSQYSVLDMIAGFCGGLNIQPDNGAAVYTQTLGMAPERQFIVTWKDIPIWYNEGALVTFQIELREDDEIFARYKDMRNGSGNAATGKQSTAGMQNATGTDGTQWCYNEENALTNGLAVRYWYAPAMIKTTDPANWDTDGDGIDDGFEEGVFYLDPLDPFDGAEDLDDDGLLNLLEYQIGTNLNNEDSDGDDLVDWGEYTYGLDPTNALPSEMVIDSDGDGMTNGYEVANYLDPFDATDKHLDRDHDGLDNYWEYTNGLSASQWDTDGDTIPDGIEVAWGTDPLVPDDLLSDNDDDGLSLGDEYTHGTNPNNDDSDGDGTGDGAEVGQGGSPNNDSDGGAPPDTSDIVELKLTVGDHSGSHSEIYELALSGERAARLHSGSYGNVVAKTFKLKKGESYTITLTHAGSNLETPDYDYTALLELVDGEEGAQASGIMNIVLDLEGVEDSDSGAMAAMSEGSDLVLANGGNLAIIEDDEGKLIGVHSNEAFEDAPRTAKIDIFKFRMVTPSGDPVSAPDTEGDGQNEFVYDSQAQLEVKMKVKVTPKMRIETILDDVFFEVADINGATLTWSTAGGFPTLSADGEHIEATATFDGWAVANDGFGKKQVLLKAKRTDGVIVGSFYEVFFDPDDEVGNEPLWFKYFKDGNVVSGMQDVDYVRSLGAGTERAKYNWNTSFSLGSFSFSDEIILELQTYDLLVNQATYTSPDRLSTQYGCESVAAWLAHEFKHRDTVGVFHEEAVVAANVRVAEILPEDLTEVLLNQILAEEKALLDADGDLLIDSMETSYDSRLDPTNPISNGDVEDAELIAYGAMLDYEDILNREKDWSKGGAQWGEDAE